MDYAIVNDCWALLSKICFAIIYSAFACSDDEKGDKLNIVILIVARNLRKSLMESTDCINLRTIAEYIKII